MKLKKIISSLIFSIALILPFSALAQENPTPPAENTGLFTIYPSYTHEGNSNWIIHSTVPGTTIRDFVTVENLSNEPIELSLKFYEATEENESFKPKDNQEFENIGNWFAIEQDTITLPAESKEKIPFTFQIPEHTRFDDFKGVIFAEYTSNAAGPINIPITTRIGTRTYISISDTPTEAIVPQSPSNTSNYSILIGLGIIIVSSSLLFIQKKKSHTAIAVLLILASSTISNTYTNAQVLEVEISRGGYLLDGPREINFQKIETSLDENISVVNFRDLPTKPYLEIHDQTGGTPFSVSVSATDFSSENGTIANRNLYIKNHDNKSDIQILEGDSEGIELNSSTDIFSPLSETQTIFDRLSGENPGKWRIAPSLQLIIPPNTKSGTYTTNITFTII